MSNKNVKSSFKFFQDKNKKQTDSTPKTHNPPPNKLNEQSSNNVKSAFAFFRNRVNGQQDTNQTHIKPKEPLCQSNPNVRSAFEFFHARVKLSENIQKAPQHVQKEARNIEQALQNDTFIQDNVYIEIGYDSNRTNSINDNKNTNNNMNTNSNIRNKPNITQASQPPTSKIINRIPSSSQVSVINKTHIQEPVIQTDEAMKPLVSSDEDSAKLARFNNYMLNALKKENTTNPSTVAASSTQLSAQNDDSQKVDISRLRSNRRRKKAPA